jgi:hemerythrin superfamily protein
VVLEIVVVARDVAMNIQIPSALKAEHEELHEELRRATKAGGRTGEAAKAVATLMHPHFIKEEEYAFPPLGLLGQLAKGKQDAAMSDVISMTDKLEAELPAMLAEHKEIVEALERLIEAAKSENMPEYVRFAERLMAHARAEEEVSYPTALLIGRYLKAVLPGPKTKAA